MPGRRLLCLLTLLGLLLGACAPQAQLTPIPEKQALTVRVSPGGALIRSKLSACAAQLAGSELVIDEIPFSEVLPPVEDVTFYLGQKPTGDLFVSVPGAVRVVAIQNPQNPLPPLDQEALKKLLTERPADEASATGTPLPTLIFFRLGGYHDLTAWAEDAFLGGKTLQAERRLALDAADLQAKVAGTPGSLALIAEPDLLPEYQSLRITGPDQKPLVWEVPLVAVSNAVPEGDAYQLLLCLQESWAD